MLHAISFGIYDLYFVHIMLSEGINLDIKRTETPKWRRNVDSIILNRPNVACEWSLINIMDIIYF